jgi:site-specific DNA-cytosine methylase
MKRQPTVVHLFSGIGGCTLGFKRAGFRSLASIDFDAKACEQLRKMTRTPAFCRDLSTMQPADLRGIVPESPDVLVMSPPCKSFSGCMPAARAAEEHYVDMSQLAVRGTFLALETWEKPPGMVLIENVPRIQTRGAGLLEQIIKLLHRYGYATDQRVHDCGELGGLAQIRRRFLLMARHMERVPAFLRRPPAKRVRAAGEVLLPLPSPVADHGDPMHVLPLLSPLNWLRLALIPPGKDWRALPEAVRIGGPGPAENRHAGKMGVEDPDAPAHTVVGSGSRPGSGWASFADPRVGWDVGQHGGRPDSYGVADLGEPSLTIRGRSDIQTSRSSIADPRLAPSPTRFKGKLQVSSADLPSNTITGSSAQPGLGACAVLADPRLGERPGRQNGGFGVEDATAPTHAVLSSSNVWRTWSGLADPRLGCEQRTGSYGVQAADQPSATIVGHHSHDNSPGSLADPRLSYHTADDVARADGREAGAGFSGRGAFGVIDPAKPSPAIRSHHTVRQAPAAIVDDRGWPIATHDLVLEDDGIWTLYGPPIDLTSKRPCLLVIRVRGKWHRPLTPREKFTLQSGPVDHVVEGPLSSTKMQAGVNEWIGNMIPVDAAEAMGLEAIVCLESSTIAGFLKGPDVWVRQPAAAMEATAA